MSLTAYYPLNGNANASVGSYNGSATNITWVPGLAQAQCASFNGSSSFISFGSPIASNAEKSVSCWVKSSQSGQYPIILDNSNAGVRGILLAINNSSFLIAMYNGGTIWSYTLARVSGWNFITITYNGTTNANSVKVYLQGVLIAQGSPTLMDGYPSANMYFGKYSGGWFFNGLLSDVKFNSATLSPAAIKNEYAHKIGFF